MILYLAFLLLAVAKTEEQKEAFEFQAEVGRLLDIIINSLYTEKEIFLRELISNAADALDKIRFHSVADSGVLGQRSDLEVKIEFDEANHTITITDTGIGMTKNELIQNLGTIAKSGTSAFLEAIQGGNLNIIGQFGVGFYSAFLVSEKVTVISKNNDDEQYIWESTATNSFTVHLDPNGNTLKRGTKVILQLKSDALDFLEQTKLEELIGKYSQFIDFPIWLRGYKQILKRVDESEEPEDETEDDDLAAMTGKPQSERELEKEQEQVKAGIIQQYVLEAKLKEEEKRKAEAADDSKEAAENQNDEVKKDNKDRKKANDEKKKTKDADKKKDAGSQNGSGSRVEKQVEWKIVNTKKAIWTRPVEEISDEEYEGFFKQFAKDVHNPLAWSHFKTEGELSFTGLLYLPAKAPRQLFQQFSEISNNLRLYVRRILIKEQLDDLLPMYLRFIKGIIDSDDLPITVSRDSVSHQKMFTVLTRKIVRKAVDMITDLGSVSKKVDEEDDSTSQLTEDEKRLKQEALDKKRHNWEEFWDQFGKNVKLGIIDDSSNRERLASISLWYSSKEPDDYITLDTYISRMKVNQREIYYLADESKEHILSHPTLQKLLKMGYEVLLLNDPLDEFAMKELEFYDGRQLVNVGMSNFQFPAEDKSEKARLKQLTKIFKPLTDWWKKILKNDVTDVVVSLNLLNDPCVLVGKGRSVSANMEKIQKAQSFSAFMPRDEGTSSSKILEINPDNLLIQTLLSRVQNDADSETEEIGTLLYQLARISSGYDIEDPNQFSKGFYKLYNIGLGLPPDENFKEYKVIVHDNVGLINDDEDENGDKEIAAKNIRKTADEQVEDL